MAIYKRGNVWWMDVYVGEDRRRVRKSTGCTDITQARLVEQTAVAVNKGITTRQRAMAIVDAILPAERRGLLIDDMVEWYRNTAESERSVPSKLEWQKRLNALRRVVVWLKDNSRVKWAQDVDVETAWNYAKAFGSRGVSAKTQNNEVGHIRTAWSLMIKYGKAQTNPWEQARTKSRVEEEKHGRAFTAEEIRRILSASEEIGCEWKEVVTVALYTGLRKRDVECLMWNGDPELCVIADLNRRLIYGTPSKTKGKRIRVYIPMHDAVFSALTKAYATRTNEYVFPWRQSHPNGQRPKQGDHFFSEVLSLAGITGGARERISFHCLRHTFVSRLAEAGVPEDVRMRLAGHTNTDTHAIYTHDDSSAAAAIAKL